MKLWYRDHGTKSYHLQTHFSAIASVSWHRSQDDVYVSSVQSLIAPCTFDLEVSSFIHLDS